MINYFFKYANCNESVTHNKITITQHLGCNRWKIDIKVVTVEFNVINYCLTIGHKQKKNLFYGNCN